MLPDEGSVEHTAIGLSSDRSYVPELESLRGIAIALVYAFHLDAFVAPEQTDPQLREVPQWLAFIRAGHTGVTLFFVLSGFLLSLPFLAEAVGGRPVSVARYAGRRALRILPLYYVAVVVGTVMTATTAGDLWHAVPYLAFLQSVAGWTEDLGAYSAVWWSLATEVQFYLLLPLLPLFVRTRGGRIAALGVLSAYAAAYVGYLTYAWTMHSLAGELTLELTVFGRGSAFLAGIAVAAVHLFYGPRLVSMLGNSAWVRRWGADLGVVVLVVLLGRLLQWKVSTFHWDAEVPPWQCWHVAEAILWAAILAAVLMTPTRARTMLRNPALQWLGICSYSIYMWHVPLITTFFDVMTRLGLRWNTGWNAVTVVVGFAATGLCLSISHFTYRFIERPFLLWKSRIA
ncbi:MAG TPA: acyltransferase [Candidatus Limnocylindrales bacterium]|nr:acyltransferase [Candidatus Limnocylindrales bacterium]